MKKGLYIFWISVIITIILSTLLKSPFGIQEILKFNIILFVGFILISLWTIFCLKKYSKDIKLRNILIPLSLGVSLLELLLTKMEVIYLLESLPILIIWNLGILSGYIYSRCKNNLQRVICTIIILSSGAWLSFFGYNIWEHKLNYDEYNGRFVERMNMPINFEDMKGRDVYLSDLKGKYVILNIWSTSNEDCVSNFNEVQKCYDYIKSRNNILLYSVFCLASNENFKTGSDILQKGGYSMPQLGLRRGYSYTWLGIDELPTTMIIDQRSNVIYRGDFGSAIKIVESLN